MVIVLQATASVAKMLKAARDPPATNTRTESDRGASSKLTQPLDLRHRSLSSKAVEVLGCENSEEIVCAPMPVARERDAAGSTRSAPHCQSAPIRLCYLCIIELKCDNQEQLSSSLTADLGTLGQA